MSNDTLEAPCNNICVKTKEIDEIHNRMVRLDVAVFGNGDPKKGLVWKIEKNTEFIDLVRSVFKPLAISCIAGVLAAVANFLLNIWKIH